MRQERSANEKTRQSLPVLFSLIITAQVVLRWINLCRVVHKEIPNCVNGESISLKHFSVKLKLQCLYVSLHDSVLFPPSSECYSHRHKNTCYLKEVSLS